MGWDSGIFHGSVVFENSMSEDGKPNKIMGCLVAHPTARKWVITPVINGIFVGLIHINHWGYSPLTKFVGWATKCANHPSDPDSPWEWIPTIPVMTIKNYEAKILWPRNLSYMIMYYRQPKGVITWQFSPIIYIIIFDCEKCSFWMVQPPKNSPIF